MISDFQIALPQYSGPLDLLLHIVRREEIALSELPLARAVDQYLDYLEVLVELQIDDVGDFLEIASLLMEWKSIQAIPSQSSNIASADSSESFHEISEDLVQRLIEYKQIRDASHLLGESGRRWQLRYSRLSSDLPVQRPGTSNQPIESIQIWDIVSAFGRLLRERQPASVAQIVHDETPIHVYMSKIHSLIAEERRVELTSLFGPEMHKSALVAMFLATLELTRHYGVSTDQAEPQKPLYLVAGEGFETVVNFAEKSG